MIDSLENILKNKSIHDTTRLEIKNKILHLIAPSKRKNYNDNMLALASKYLKKSQDTILNKIYLKYIADAYFNQCVFFSDEAKIDSAIIAAQQCIKTNIILKRNKQLANAYVGLGSIYIRQGNYLEATDLFYKAISLLEKANEWEGIGDAYENLARIYYTQDNYNKTIECLRKAQYYYEKCQYVPGVIEILNKFSTVYIAKADNDKAINVLEQSIAILEKQIITSGSYLEEMLFANYATLHLLKKEMTLAIQFYEKSIEATKQNGNVFIVGHRKFDIARAYFKLKDYRKAESVGNEALKIAQERSEKDLEASVTKLLSEVYEKLNNYQLAYQMQRTYLILQEEVRKEKDERQIIEQQFKYEYAKKELIANVEQEKKILELDLLAKEKDAQKNRWIVVLLASFLILLMIAYFIYQSQKQKNTIAIQHSNLLKQKLLSSQMNPHFIFNSLNAIQNFIIKNNSLQASIYLSKFSEMIRMILNFSRKDYITLEAELKFLNHYLELQQLRSEQNFEYSFEIEEEVETDTILVPPMLAQPFIENAVEHGGFNQDRKGHILISFRIQNEQLVCVVEDDGIGLKKSQEMKIDAQQKHESLALTITKERLETLFGAKNEKYQIDLVDKKDITPSKTGTKAIFSIPLKVA